MSPRIDPARTALVSIDWQERLFLAMPPAVRDDALRRAGDLSWLAGALGMPIIASEQYPRGLGPTLDAMRVADTVEKLTFSAMGAPAFAGRIRASGRAQALVTGMETHVCVAQTCRDLLDDGVEVFVVADACLSRRKLDWRLGLAHARDLGARVVTAEAASFDLLGTAEHAAFRELSRRVR